jgi:ceramide glucosyltransferase
MILSYLFLGAVLVSVCYALYAGYCTWTFFIRKPRTCQKPSDVCPPISIIKPVDGATRADLKNFITFCRQDYPEYEIVFAFSNPNDPVRDLVEDLKQRFPEQPISWVAVPDNPGPNYKVGNLMAAIAKARYDTLAISDADIRVTKDYLKHLSLLLAAENVGSVTCLYRNIDIDRIPAALQSLTLQTDFIPNVVLGIKLEGLSYAFGATIATTKAILAKSGGLELIRSYLADDYQLGNRIAACGYQVVLAPYLADHVMENWTLGHYFHHQLRWAITQRICRPRGYLASIITHSTALALLFWAAAGFSLNAMFLLAFVCILRMVLFAGLNTAIFHNHELITYLWLIPLNDLINTFIWLISLCKNDVFWQGRRFKVISGGKMVECGQKREKTIS